MKSIFCIGRKGRLFLFAVAVLLAGCATAGRPFMETSVREIVTGQTTQTELRRLFGPPWRTGLEDGLETWTYGHYRYSLFRPEKSSDLVIRFNDSGVVSSYSYSTTRDSDK